MAFSINDVESVRRAKGEPGINGLLNRVVGYRYEKYDMMKQMQHYMSI